MNPPPVADEHSGRLIDGTVGGRATAPPLVSKGIDDIGRV